jgi:F-type H+-transporting ATPase subunit delta
MASTRAAKRYAKALFDLSQSEKATEKVVEDMMLIKETMADSRDLKNTIENPIIDVQKKLSILKEVFSNTHKLSQRNFEVLAENDRISLVGEVANQFIEKYREFNNIKEALVTTAFPLNDELKKKVMQKVEQLTNASVTLKEHVDKELIGGFILRVDDLQFDASVSGRLNTLKHQLKASVAV